MYGNCHKCGALFGTKDGINFYKPCEHILEESRKIMKDTEITPNNRNYVKPPHR